MRKGEFSRYGLQKSPIMVLDLQTYAEEGLNE